MLQFIKDFLKSKAKQRILAKKYNTLLCKLRRMSFDVSKCRHAFIELENPNIASAINPIFTDATFEFEGIILMCRFDNGNIVFYTNECVHKFPPSFFYSNENGNRLQQIRYNNEQIQNAIRLSFEKELNRKAQIEISKNDYVLNYIAEEPENIFQ